MLYVLLEVEIKNKVCDSELEYVDEGIIGGYKTLEQAQERLKVEIEDTLNRGYFHKIISQFPKDYRILLHNGGSCYKLYSIMKVSG